MNSPQAFMKALPIRVTQITIGFGSLCVTHSWTLDFSVPIFVSGFFFASVVTGDFQISQQLKALIASQRLAV